MTRSFLRTGLGLWLALLATQGAAQQAGEEPVTGFGVAPTSVTIDAHPGRRAESRFTIVCQKTLEPLRFRIQLMDVGQRKGGVKYPVEAGRGARSAARWITIASEVVVPPKGRQEVPFTISVPPNAQGAYFAYVIVQEVPKRPEFKIVTTVLPTRLAPLSRWK